MSNIVNFNDANKPTIEKVYADTVDQMVQVYLDSKLPVIVLDDLLNTVNQYLRSGFSLGEPTTELFKMEDKDEKFL